ncbi:hypothetical protein TCAL_13419 [Tigriopus californicus]|uniref:Tim10-like domain-containing protein n=2 Tax=Tigriopus californicus TaxID=6832 RepID=A0A553P736_TIGCA|nr:hypothetical protein TCAL_13419 [Tigriopus californicus]
MAMPHGVALQNFREFLEVYNRISEHCFNHCVLNMNDRQMTSEESGCVNQCAEKNMRVNHKMLGAFMVEQPKIMEQKAEAAQKEADEVMRKLQEQGVDATNLTPEQMAQKMMESKFKYHQICKLRPLSHLNRPLSSSIMASAKPQICILVLLGLPGSGKTTLAQNMRVHLKEKFKVILVSYDDLIPLAEQAQLSQNSDDKAWKEARKLILNGVHALINPAQSGLSLAEVQEFKTKLGIPEDEPESSKDTLVIVDDNNYYASMRYEYYQLARSNQTGFCQLHIDVGLTEAQNRNEERDQKIPNEVIQVMDKRFEAPNPLKNSWEQFSFSTQVIQNDSSNLIEMVETIVSLALNNPVKPIPEVDDEARDRSRAKCTASIVHQADKVLRKHIGRKMKDVKSEREGNTEAMEDAIALFNESRTEVLEDLKTGFTMLPSNVVKRVENRDKLAIDELEAVIVELWDLKITKLKETI